MKTCERIKCTRENLGISHEEIAQKIGISIEAMRDIEDYEDELFESVELSVIKKMANFLNLSYLQLLGLEMEDVTSIKHSKHQFISLKRQKKNMSQEQLADIIGFNFEVIQKLESDPKAIEHVLPYSTIVTLSEVLDIPINFLVQ